MEGNLPIITKKLWNMVKIAFFMVKKGITTKKKLLLDLNLMMKRGKLKSKVALKNLLFHHYHHHHHQDTFPSKEGVFEPSHLQFSPTDSSQDSDISCTNSPEHHPTNHPTKKKTDQINKHGHSNSFYYTPPRTFECTAESFEAIYKILEAVSPIPSKVTRNVRQLRITDSPFPLQNEEGCDRRVDQAADDFIKRFYSRLEKQICD